MIFVGPRVIQRIGEDYKALNFMCIKLNNGVPYIAITVQTVISLILLFTSTFEALITYLGFVMYIFSLLTVAGVYIHRKRYPDIKRPYKTWGYPIIPAIFVVFVLWSMFYLFKIKTTETLTGIATLAIGYIVYLLIAKKK